jgi:hypothetical protein
MTHARPFFVRKSLLSLTSLQLINWKLSYLKIRWRVNIPSYSCFFAYHQKNYTYSPTGQLNKPCFLLKSFIKPLIIIVGNKFILFNTLASNNGTNYRVHKYLIVYLMCTNNFGIFLCIYIINYLIKINKLKWTINSLAKDIYN